MALYRCYLMNRAAIENVEIIEADSDEDAIRQARTVFLGKMPRFSEFQIRDRARVVYRSGDRRL